MREAADGVIGVAGRVAAEVFVVMSVLFYKYVPKAARRHPLVSTVFDHDTAPNGFQHFSAPNVCIDPAADGSATSRPHCINIFNVQ